MDAFNFVFSLFGLLLGLALAELLSGFGAAFQERHKLRIGWLTPLLGLIVACNLLIFWLGAWLAKSVVPVTYLVLLCTLLITGLYYLSARLVFPHDRVEWPDYDVYYFAHRRLVIGGIVLCSLLFQLGQLALGVTGYKAGDIILDVVLFGQAAALMLISNRRVSIALLLFWFVQNPVLGVLATIAHR